MGDDSYVDDETATATGAVDGDDGGDGSSDFAPDSSLDGGTPDDSFGDGSDAWGDASTDAVTGDAVTPGTYVDSDGGVHMAQETITAHGPDADPNQDYPDLDPMDHTVQDGDTLQSIADRYGVDPQTLIHNNPHIQNPDRIYPGQSVHIPQRKDPRQALKEMPIFN